MELQVTITLTDRLFDLLEDKLPNLGRRVEKIITKELGRQARSETVVTVSSHPSEPKEETAETVTSEPSPAEEVQPAASDAEDAPTSEPKEKELTEEDVRAAMHRTRQRFEGEDYKDNSDSDRYKKYHKALTSHFKQIAISLGADKPSNLAPERRAMFIADCDALIIDDAGFISAPQAPF